MTWMATEMMMMTRRMAPIKFPEENILNSIKQQGAKFGEHLKSRPLYLKQMLDYVTSEQSASSNAKKLYKYSHLNIL